MARQGRRLWHPGCRSIGGDHGHGRWGAVHQADGGVPDEYYRIANDHNGQAAGGGGGGSAQLIKPRPLVALFPTQVIQSAASFKALSRPALSLSKDTPGEGLGEGDLELRELF